MQPRPAHAAVPAAIKVADSDGRVTEEAREEWRKTLPDNFKKCWDAPDDLANLVTTCLRDGFAAESLEGAQQLHRIDPQPKRGAGLLGATLLQLQRFGEAEKGSDQRSPSSSMAKTARF